MHLESFEGYNKHSIFNEINLMFSCVSDKLNILLLVQIYSYNLLSIENFSYGY
jgi:hypothetical protein